MKRRPWRFTISEQGKGGKYRAVRTRGGAVKVYRTKGRKHIRVINLGKGRYKARSKPGRGYAADTSTVVRLRR